MAMDDDAKHAGTNKQRAAGKQSDQEQSIQEQGNQEQDNQPSGSLQVSSFILAVAQNVVSAGPSGDCWVSGSQAGTVGGREEEFL